MKFICTVSTLVLIFASSLFADFSYRQSTEFTGGMMVSLIRMAGKERQPVWGVVQVKGGRMVHESAGLRQIIDVDAETITAIDLEKKTYSVMTFSEMAQSLSAAGPKEGSASFTYQASVRETGVTQPVAGAEAREVIFTVDVQGKDPKSGREARMAVISNMWITKPMPGYEEFRAFEKRLSAKLHWSPADPLLGAGATPEMIRSAREVSGELRKLDGVPVRQIVTLQLDPKKIQQEPAGAKKGSAAAPGGPKVPLPGLAGLEARIRRNQPQEPAEGDTLRETAKGTWVDNTGMLMQLTTEMSQFSPDAVPLDRFTVPAGYQKMPAELKNFGRRPF